MATDTGFHWFCERCDELKADGYYGEANLQSQYSLQQKNYDGHGREKKIMMFTTGINKNWKNLLMKENVQEVDLLSIGKKLEEKVDTVSQHPNAKKYEVDKMTAKVEKQKIADGHGVLDKVEDVVRKKLQDDKQEEYEQQRNSNISVHGVAESQELRGGGEKDRKKTLVS